MLTEQISTYTGPQVGSWGRSISSIRELAEGIEEA